MMSPSAPRATPGRGDWQDEIARLDVALYAAIAATPTPQLDRCFRPLSRAADHSKLWIAAAGALAATGGRRGRRAAVDGVASIAVTSAVVNVLLKPLSRRRRPDRRTYEVPAARRVSMPHSTSFPSGHAASASAFATAALVAYSRVHTGVHYPSDAIAGSVIGAALAPAVIAALDRRWPPAPHTR